MELQNGRPDNTEGRLEKELRVYDLLDRLGVAYQRVDHEAAMTMEACEEIDRVLGDGTAICKNTKKRLSTAHDNRSPAHFKCASNHSAISCSLRSLCFGFPLLLNS